MRIHNFRQNIFPEIHYFCGGQLNQILKMKKYLFLILLPAIFFGCGSSSKVNSPHAAVIDKLFSNKLVVILAQEPDPDGYSIKIQDFVQYGVSFIPVFTSKETMKKSTNNAELGKPVYEIEGVLIASLLNSEDQVRINPGLKDQVILDGEEIKEVMKEKINKFKLKLMKEPN